jgi:hypothetical protein
VSASGAISAGETCTQLEHATAVSRAAGLRPAGRRLGLLLPALGLAGLPRGWKHDGRLERRVNRSEQPRAPELDKLAVFLARTGVGKEAIREEIAGRFGYDLGRSVDAVRPSYRFDETCQRTVPEALITFFDSTGFEHAVRLAVSLGGDADTLACITGSVAEAFYGSVPAAIAEETLRRLTPEMLGVLERFDAEFARLDR